MTTNNDVTAPLAAAATQPARVFVGLKITPVVARKLAQTARTLERFPVRLVAPADIHLTLVPPWQESNVPDAIEKLRHVANGFRAFPLTFQHVGYGPQAKRPRLLWIECTADDQITAFHAALLEAYRQSEERPFRPHVTVARIRGIGSAIARACPINQDLCLTQQVDSVELFQSPPAAEKGYRVLASVRIGEETPPTSNS